MSRCIALVLACWLAGGPRAAADESSEAEAFFETRIRPVLAGTCFKCHGGEKTSSDLRVDSREALLKGGASGAALVPGQPADSLLWQAISYDDAAPHMPPDGPLAAHVVADFAVWIEAGAPWPTVADEEAFSAGGHWAFQPVAVVVPPDRGDATPAHPIDRFLLEKQRERGTVPVERAERRTLIRRLSFDLVGLPPAPEEVEAFVSDDDPLAWENLVERLLAAPHYGERWGRHWMDLVRYADTAGDNADYPVPEAHLYRDYIIDALNADLPYDQFVAEQLAGDVMAAAPGPRYAQQVAATGFLALSRRYGTMPGELWHLTLEDTIDATGRALLGLTLRCARCHDHKYDPITTADYYGLYGILASTKFPYAGSEEFQSKQLNRAGFVPLVPSNEAAPAIAQWQTQIAALEARIAAGEKGPSAAELAEVEKQLAAAQSKGAGGGVADVERLRAQRDDLRKRLGDELRPLRDEVRRLKRIGSPPDLPVAYAVSEGPPVDEAIHVRGEPGDRGPVVARNVPAAIRGSRPFTIAPGSSGRLELARWLTSAENPLVARVIVNRVWQHHFGRGLVATPSNFGLRGSPPTHPELLDWLAGQFIAEGWSLKRLHRLIVTSEAYRRQSTHVEANAAIDPDNLTYWRFDRRRLDAEAIRDAVLCVSGKLDPRRPGAQPFPPILDWNWTQHNPFRPVYVSDHRTVYLMTQRIQRHPFLALFDGPDTNSSTDLRTRATVPLQALFWMNSPWVAEQAGALAGRVCAAAKGDEARIDYLHMLAWGRHLSAEEQARARAFVAAARQANGGDDGESAAWASLARVVMAANEFLYVD